MLAAMDDEKFMHAALRQAERGVGQTSPNPTVGAVIVRGSRIVARGFHHGAGLPHAEIEAVRALRSSTLSRGATMYVTLEPCSTHGRTPPCVEALVAAGVGRVVIGTQDPNPVHAGRGLELLRAAGIAVTSGVLEAECRRLNAAFNHWIVNRTPYVITKVGMSLDGRLTRPPGEGQWLTSPASRADAQRLRAKVDAILVGAGTVRADNPRLTVRGIPGARQPWRIVLTRTGDLPRDAHIFTDDQRQRTRVFQGKSLRQVLAILGREQITSVLIEGGMRVMGEAFDRRLVHEVHGYVAPLLCGGPVVAVGGRGVGASADSVKLIDVCYRKIGNDVHFSARVETDVE